MRYTSFYGVWCNIKRRCSDKKGRDYKYYSGRGIKMCESWHKFENFKSDMYESYLEHKRNNSYTSIDRIDNNGNYEPSNCRWAGRSEQLNNTRHNHLLTSKGQTLNLTQWAKKFGIARGTIKGRIKSGWSVEKALTVPVTDRNRYLTYKGQTKSLTEWGQILNITTRLLSARMCRLGWSVEKTLSTPIRKLDKKIYLTFKGRTESMETWAKELNINYGTLYARLWRYKWSINEALSSKIN